jgi:hypothetical protein
MLRMLTNHDMVVTTSIDSKEFRIHEYYIKILNKENTFC